MSLNYKEKLYIQKLNELGIPDHDLESNGGRIPDYENYGTWIMENDPVAFNVGFNEWERECYKEEVMEKTIIIEIQDGVLTTVSGVPKGYDVICKDYDTDGINEDDLHEDENGVYSHVSPDIQYEGE